MGRKRKLKTRTQIPPQVRAFMDFCEQNPDDFVSRTLGTTNPDFYLEARLLFAFKAGWQARESLPTTTEQSSVDRK